MSRIVVLNQHTNNFGDDAAGSALIGSSVRLLNADEVDIYYIWHRSGGRIPAPDGVCRHHKPTLLAGARDRRPRMVLVALAGWLSPRLLPREFRDMVATCHRADAVFVSPAGSNIGIYKDWMYLLTLLIVVHAGIRPIFCQNTIGASNSRVFNRVARRMLRRSQLHVRELASQEYLSELGLQSSLGVDTALLLPPLEEGYASTRSVSDSSRAGGYIAVVPTQLGNWHRDHRAFDDEKMLFGTLADSVSAVARDHDLRVVLVPHLHGPEAEADMLHGIADAVSANGTSVEIAALDSLDGYRRTLAAADVVVSMRYHGLVLAALAGVPCVSLSYENKMVEAARYLGLSALALDVRSASEVQIRECLDLALDRPATLTTGMKSRLDVATQVAAGPVLEAAARISRSTEGFSAPRSSQASRS